VLLVEGDAGIGKTALVRAFLAEEPGTPVTWASGDEFEVDLAFGVAAQLLGADPAELQRTSDELAVGGRMLTALSERERAGPFVVIIDDLGWADLPSLRSMSFALRRLRAGPILVIATVRPEHLGRIPNGMLRALEDRGERLRLEGLTVAQLGELASAAGQGPIPVKALRRLAEHTSGNPLHARALLSEVDVVALAALDDDDPLPAPRSMVDLVVARLDALPADAERLAVAATVLGGLQPLGSVTAVAAVDEPARALDELVASGLCRVEPGPAGPTVAVVHPLVRSAIYHGVPLAERSELHRRAASLADDDATALRHRAAAVTAFDDELAQHLVAVGEEHLALPAGATEAASWFQAAARISSRRPVREELLLRALDAYLAAGDNARAGSLALLLPDLADTPRKRYLEGTLRLFRGDLAAAEVILRDAWDTLDPVADPALGAALAGRLAVVNSNLGELDEALLWADRSSELDPADSRPVFTRIVALAASGRTAEARAASDVAGISDPELLLPRLSGRGVVRVWNDDPAGARADLLRAADLARAGGVFHPYGITNAYCAEAEYRLGLWDEAQHRAELMASLATDLDQVWFLPLAHGTAALPSADRGQWEAAERHVAAALAAASTTGDAASVMWARTAEAVLATARGDHRVAVAAASACLEHPGVVRYLGLGIKPWRVLGAEAAAALGEVEMGERFLAGLEAPDGQVTPALSLARARARLAAASGDDAEASAQLELAAALVARVPLPFEQGLHHLAFGAHLRRQGRRRQAAEELGAAHAAFVRLAATPWVERADRELTACNPSAARRHGARPVELTPQERSVVRLVCEGRRNREVAAELFVNVKTVEYHLSSVYRKLGVSNRTQLVAIMAAAPG
jgi:DNA-binding CsgD family transcriptional regulator